MADCATRARPHNPRFASGAPLALRPFGCAFGRPSWPNVHTGGTLCF